MSTEVHEQEEKGTTFRAGVLLYLACIAVCGIFFSLGFLVGFNERGARAANATTTEVVNGPATIPPTINPPPDTGQTATPDSSTTRTPANAEPETEIISTKPSEPISAPAAEKPSSAPSAKKRADEAATSPPALSETGEGVTLQVAALRTRQDADTMVHLLKGRGYPVFMAGPGDSGDSLYRVEVGPFRTRAEADKAKDKLVQDGFKPFIKH